MLRGKWARIIVYPLQAQAVWRRGRSSRRTVALFQRFCHPFDTARAPSNFDQSADNDANHVLKERVPFYGYGDFRWMLLAGLYFGDASLG